MNSEEMKKLAEEIGQMSDTQRKNFLHMVDDARRIEKSSKLLEEDVDRTLFGVSLIKDDSRYFNTTFYHADVTEQSQIDLCSFSLTRRIVFEENDRGENISFKIYFEAAVNFDGMNIQADGDSAEECELKLTQRFYERKSQFASDVNAFEKAFFKKEKA